MAGTSEAIAAYDRALDGLLRFSPSTLEHLDEARRADPECPLVAVCSAYIGLGSTDTRAVAGAVEDLSIVAPHEARLTIREQRHWQAATVWSQGRAHEASEILETILVDHPGDLLALAIGHQLDFLLGDAAGLRRRPARSLPRLAAHDERTGFVHGMLAFGLEESGTYDAALHHAEMAIARSVDDVWAIHAAAHVFEMRGDVAGGLEHLDDLAVHWQTDNWMHNHNAWHRCLFLLATGRIDDVLACYDDELRHGSSDELPMPLADAASLLWRLELIGVDVGDRWKALAAAWAGSLEPGFYVFNDMHAAMALARGGAPGAARDLVEALGRVDVTDRGADVLAVGRVLIAGMVSFADRDEEQAIDLLMSTAGRDHLIGGSAAQRDVISLTIAAAAQASGRREVAMALAAERLALQPDSPLVQRAAMRRGLLER